MTRNQANPADSSDLMKRLTLLRGTVRRRLVTYGVCAVAAGGVVSFLAIIILDWLLWLPAALRLVGGVLFLAGFVAATMHWIVRPLQARIRLAELAARLERHFGTLEDRLSSAVNFLERPDAAATPLEARVIEDAERTMRHYSLESALSTGPLYRTIAWFAMSMTVLAVVVVSGTDWARIGLYRYVHPMGDIEWPRTVSITPMTRDQAVAIGESVTVRMEISRGLTDSLRGEVHLREPDGRAWTLAMQRDADGSFYATIDAVTEDLRYWFVAGDDSTARAPFTIRVVRRPEVVEALVTVEPPEYANQRHPRVVDLADGEVEAPLGGVVRIDVTASKPVAAKHGSAGAALVTAAGALVPLVADEQDATRLGCRLTVSEDMTFRIHLRDRDGLENHGALDYVIRAVPDAPPVVTVLEPQALVEVTPTGAVQLAVRATDDFGIVRLELDAMRDGESAAERTPLSITQATYSDSGVEVVTTLPWAIAPLKVSPGDVVTYSVLAWDNYTETDAAGQMGQSTPQRLRIISKGEFEVRLRSDLAQVEARIRQMALEQAELLDASHNVLSESDVAPERRRVTVADVAGGQANLVRRVRDVSRRVSELVERMTQNLGDDEESRDRVERLGQSLTAVADGAMSKAAMSLAQAVERQDVSMQDADLAEGATAQEESLEQLHALLRSMAQWGQFQGLVAKMRGLLERQDALRAETSQLGLDMLGKTAESLSPEEAARLKRVERKQQQVADDIEQMLSRMKRLREQEAQKDPAGAEAVEQAIRAARAHEVDRHTEAATEAIRENRTAAASIEQKAVSSGLREVLRALQQREDRELAELRKAIRELAELVAEIIEQEQALRGATHEASLMDVAEEDMDALEQEQRRLRRNTLSLGNEVAGLQEHADLARYIRSGGRSMRDAETLLVESRAADAVEKQDESIEALNEALSRLEQRADEVEQDIVRRSLAQIREELEAIRDAQQAVNEGIDALNMVVARLERLGRAQAREASSLTRRQGEVRDSVDAVMPDFEKVVVYRFAMDRVAQDMDDVRERLRQRRIDDDLVDLSQHIVDRLEVLIRAAIETAELPAETEFVETSEGEGGGGAAGQRADGHKPVPTITELIVLRTMQEDVNRRTVELGRRMKEAEPTEESLAQLKQIGGEQNQIRRLTELLTEKARRHE